MFCKFISHAHSFHQNILNALFFQHFKKSRPENIRSIEQRIGDSSRKKEQRRARKQTVPASQPSREDMLPPQKRRPSCCTVCAPAGCLSSLIPAPQSLANWMTLCHPSGRIVSPAQDVPGTLSRIHLPCSKDRFIDFQFLLENHPQPLPCFIRTLLFSEYINERLLLALPLVAKWALMSFLQKQPDHQRMNFSTTSVMRPMRKRP